MFNRCLNLEYYYKYTFNVKCTYNTEWGFNKITITICTQWKKTSVANECYNFIFHDDFLTDFSYEYLHNEGYTEIKRIDGRILNIVNIINDNVKEFYKNNGVAL